MVIRGTAEAVRMTRLTALWVTVAKGRLKLLRTLRSTGCRNPGRLFVQARRTLPLNVGLSAP